MRCPPRRYYCSLLLFLHGVQAQTCTPANYAANGSLDGVTLDSTLAFQYKDTDLGVTLPSGLTQSTSMKFLLAGDACCTGAVGVHRPESAPDSACVYCSRPHNLIPCCRLARTRVEGFSQPQTFSKGCASYLPRECTRSALHSTTPRRFSTPTIKLLTGAVLRVIRIRPFSPPQPPPPEQLPEPSFPPPTTPPPHQPPPPPPSPPLIPPPLFQSEREFELVGRAHYGAHLRRAAGDGLCLLPVGTRRKQGCSYDNLRTGLSVIRTVPSNKPTGSQLSHSPPAGSPFGCGAIPTPLRLPVSCWVGLSVQSSSCLSFSNREGCSACRNTDPRWALLARCVRDPATFRLLMLDRHPIVWPVASIVCTDGYCLVLYADIRGLTVSKRYFTKDHFRRP